MAGADPLETLRHSDAFVSSAGISSEFLTWEVAVIMIALIVALSVIVLMGLFCHDRRKRRLIGDQEQEGTTIFTEDDKPVIHRKIGVAHNMADTPPVVSKINTNQNSNKFAKDAKKNNTQKHPVKNVDKTVDGTLYLQRNAGLYSKGRHVEPLPPLPTSVFLISLPTPTDNNSIHPITERYI